jgi:hypothetical protein
MDEPTAETVLSASRLRFEPSPSEGVELFDAYLTAYTLVLSGAPVSSNLLHAWKETSKLLAAVIGAEDGRNGKRRTKTELIAEIGKGLTS